jgi:acetylornithine aminotransferase
MDSSPLMSTYQPMDVSFVRGEGAWLVDSDDRRYLDLMSGIGVCALGHAHPAVSATLCEQGSALIHTSNVFRIDAQRRLGARLTELSGMDRVFFGNSGAEANEAAIKLARLYGNRQGIERPTIVVMDGAFHGRTMATLTASGSRKVQAGFEPLLDGFVRAPFNDLNALHTIAANNTQIVAVLLEPIQGEGGIRVADADYLRGVRALCDERSWLMMLDEVQSGNGRTGRYFAYQHAGIVPDIVTTAKGLANGVPIGACLARGAAAAVFQPGSHGSTFGGNPLACAVACSVVDTIEGEGLAERATALGERLRERLRAGLEGCPDFVEVRGMGLMIGVELREPCRSLLPRALDRGLLINVTSERVVRLLPPLVIGEADALQAMDTLCELIREGA